MAAEIPSEYKLVYEAVKDGNLNLVMEILKKDSSLLQARINGDTLLHVATHFDKKELMEFFVLRGISSKEKNSSGAEPLHKAVSKMGVEELLSKGADINAQDNGGRTPLHVASLFGRAPVADFLLLKGADVNKKDKHGSTALHMAIAGGHEKLVELLILMGADVNSADSLGDTPLHSAVIYNYKNVVKTLILNKANANIKNLEGSTPLHEAHVRDMGDMILFLRQFGATE